jgi:uncharacterized protein YqcC (DUF446 family)
MTIDPGCAASAAVATIDRMDPYEEYTRREALAVVIDQLEATLRSTHRWDDEPPARHLLETGQPFCYDTLTFEQWVQWQMIPRMRQILGNHEALPESSAILPYAEERAQTAGEEGQELLHLIERFDALITG